MKLIRLNSLLILLIFISNRSFSCSCVSTTIEESLKHADVIFVGKLISVVEDGSSVFATGRIGGEIRVANFQVVKYIQGLGPQDRVISLISDGSPCDMRFSKNGIGETYIIYANKTNRDNGQLNFLVASACSNSKLTSEISDSFELMVFNSKIWKTPDSLDLLSNVTNAELKKMLANVPKREEDSTIAIDFKSYAIIGLITLNLLLTIVIVFKRK
jgi:hypothetical protein